MPPLLGCIADDFTGATDLAGILALNGMRTTVVLATQVTVSVEDADAIVVALKSRTAPVDVAVQQSLEAVRWLKVLGCRKFYFKYCSTFDSTPQGNIGPVIDALMEELATGFTIVCPAFPATGRTVYRGNLFVQEVLLSESSMRHHPLTPMHDSNLVRLLAPQTRQSIGTIPYQIVRSGAAAIDEAVGSLRAAGKTIAVADAIFDEDLRTIAVAAGDLPLLTGGSGLAMGIPGELLDKGLLGQGGEPYTLPRIKGLSAILSGSCSAATQRQVAHAQQSMATFHVDPFAAAANPDLSERIVEWATAHLQQEELLITATADTSSVVRVQQQFGAVQSGQLVEHVLAETAVRLAAIGVRRLIVAGGETSGAVAEALGIRILRIGPQIDPGVHWAFGEGEGELRMALALKSGNFGSDDFFVKAWRMLG